MLSRAGLDTATFLAEMYDSLQRALPGDAACLATLDPATHLATGAFKFGELADRDDSDELWAELEYRNVENTSFTQLCCAGVNAVAMALATNGQPERSKRFTDLVVGALDCTDELRILASDGKDLWGGIALFRSGGAATQYTEDAVAFAASLSSAFARGLRVGVLTAIARSVPEPAPTSGPGVMIFDSAGQLVQATPGAADWLSQRLASGGTLASPVIGSLIAAAWRCASGVADELPAARIRLANGMWIVLHAAPLTAGDGAATNVVLTVDLARPPDIVPVLAAAFDLTNRERDVAALILHGTDTRGIAAQLHLSAHTVHDHVKAIFDKTGVRSRRELLAQVFFEQYVPRLGNQLSPRGSLRA